MSISYYRCRDGITRILQHTDREHRLNFKDIKALLEKDTEFSFDRKMVSTVLEDMRNEYGTDEDGEWINENIMLHYDVIERNGSNIHKNYWMEITEEKAFSDDELYLLIDSVLFSKHISRRDANDLIKRLRKLSSNPYSPAFDLHREGSCNYHTASRDIFLNMGDLNKAIVCDRQVTFYENEYRIDKKLHHVTQERICVSPYRIVMVDGNYYLIGNVTGEVERGGRMVTDETIRSFRIDRLSDVEILKDTARRFVNGSMRIMQEPEQYILEHRYMHESTVHSTERVTLIIREKLIGDVIDSFGEDVVLVKEQHNPDYRYDDDITATVYSGVPDIIEWTLKQGVDAVVAAPEILRDLIQNIAYEVQKAYVAEPICAEDSWLIKYYMNGMNIEED